LQDPILVRAKTQSQRLESEKDNYRIQKALSAQRKALRSIGHVEDLTTHDGKEIEYERMMKKTAQRGVVKLFNAIRASQIKAEAALAQVKGIPRAEREEKVKEMSREGFLNLIKSG
jgi:mitochondrial fusion and transport protein UGO1